MHRILVIERSATLRHALKRQLPETIYSVTQATSFEAGLALLGAHPEDFEGVVVGWPPRTDPVADDLFALLGEPRFAHLAVLVVSQDSDPAKRTWVTRRPGTSLLEWEAHDDARDSLDQLLAGMRKPRTEAEPVRRQGEQIRVLFVDDSPTVRVNYRNLLSRYGYEVETASSVKEGVETAQRARFDIAIIDYFMPDATGDELCRQLKDNADTADITTAILTGTYLDKVIKDGLEAGAIECMFKSEAKELFLARVAAMSRSILSKRSIQAERHRLQGILGSVGDGVYGVDGAGVITFMNPAAKRILGYGDQEELVGLSPHSLFHYAFQDGTANPPETCFLTNAYATGDQLRDWQTVFWNRAGNPVPVECTVYPLHIEGVREGSVVAFRDVSERKLMEEELRWQANHDSLTKLLNRNYFEKQLDQEVARVKRSREVSALLYLDLDRFKYINDTAGHAAGDRLLLEVGQLLQVRLRASDTLARLGGDEFAIILRNSSSEDIGATADAFRAVLADHPFQYAGLNYKIHASVGVAVMDQGTHSPGEALANADIACHIAKERGRNQTHVFAAPNDDKIAMDIELGWSTRLHEALENDHFELFFQPIVAIRDLPPMSADAKPDSRWRRVLERQGNRPVYYEVLIRLRNSHGQLITPDAFLPTAERFNLMPQIDRWVLERSMEILAEVTARGESTRLSINLSGHSMGDPVLAEDIKKMIGRYGVPAGNLTFEITETSAITNIEEARRLIAELKGLGCQFALDDFGTGFCSFGHLKHLDVDFIKIDGLFTPGVVADPIDRAVVLSIVEIAHALGKRTVAEHVDSLGVLSALSECGVDYVQGHFISGPMAKVASAPASAVTSG